MKYDSSISDDVSLSRILDAMIVEGESDETIISFLKNHYKSIPEIYSHSNFVFGLYDIIRNGYIDDFFLQASNNLSDVDKIYVASTWGTWCKEYSTYFKLKEIKKNCEDGFRQFKPDRGWMCGNQMDADVFIYNKSNLVDELNKMNDIRDISSFVLTSYCLRSAMMYYNFIKLTPQTQYLILNKIKSILLSIWINSHDVKLNYFYEYLVFSLIKQCLFVNDIKLANWIINSQDKCKSWHCTPIFELMPNNIGNLIKSGASAEELIFEMNMVETQFEPIDLFVFMYLGKDFKFLNENREFIEFFNLPFNWMDLEKFK